MNYRSSLPQTQKLFCTNPYSEQAFTKVLPRSYGIQLSGSVAKNNHRTIIEAFWSKFLKLATDVPLHYGTVLSQNFIRARLFKINLISIFCEATKSLKKRIRN